MGMNTAAVQRLYVAYFNRPADPVALSVYEGKLPADRVATKAELLVLAETYFSPSAEYTSNFTGKTDAQIVDQLYTNIFGRSAEAAGLLDWAAKLTAGTITVAELALELSYSAQGTDAAVVDARIEAAVSYTAGLDTTAEITAYAGDTAAAQGRAYLAQISGALPTTVEAITTQKTATIAGVDASIAAMVTAVGDGASSALSFTLTTNADLFTGGASNDTFTAVDSTLQVIDQIDGGAGTGDSLYFTDTSNGGGIPGTAISNIEKFYIRNVETGNAGETYDFGTITGETQVWQDRATDSSTFTGLSAGATVGLKGDGSSVLGAVTFQYATASSAVGIAIDGGVGAVGVAPAITEQGTNGTATSATISSTGAANTVGTVDLAATTLTSVTITADSNLTGDFLSQATDQVGTNGTVTISGGAASVAFTAALDNTIKTIDASGLTSGGVTATLGSLVSQSFTGGGGNDTITTGAAPTSGLIDGGAGTGDTLVLGASAHLDSAAEAALFANWEILRTATSFDMGLLSSLTGLQISATAGATVFSNLSAAEAANIQILGDINAAGVTFALADGSGTDDSLTLTLGNNGAAAGTAVDADSLTLNTFETLNLVAVHGASATAGAQRTATVADFTADVLTAINLTGSAFNLQAVATTKAVTIDATALTGDGAATTLGLTAAGSLVAGSTVKGSEFGDAYTIGAVGSTYLGNGGADGFTGSQTLVAGSVSLNGGAGTDVLTLTDANATTATITIADNTFKNVSETEQLVLNGVIAGNLVWNLGGYANDFAQAAGGVLKVTAANVASGATADVITVDASGLGSGSALHLVLTNSVAVVGANAGTDVYTGSDGNDIFTINYDSDNANDDSIVTITAGAGDDTITFTMGSGNSTPGTITLTGGAGNDTITGSVELDTITGGTGTDTMAGGAGNDIFVIAGGGDSNAATAGAIDKITDFAGGGGDDLKVGAAATELNKQTVTTNYASLDTIAELNAALNSTNGTSTAKFDGTGADAAQITTSDARILVAVDIDASGTFTAADVVVELTGLTGTLAAGDIIA